MASAVPATMRSILMNKYLKPSDFQLSDTPVPTISAPDQVLIRVHAASINPSDMEAANGEFKLIITPT
jgi:NADPH:quinone reductase-like Zn-dependent oxidoreductase